MSEVTSNLKLFKYDVVEDAKQPFSIERALNDNWDLLDSKVVRKTGDTMTGTFYIKPATATGFMRIGNNTLNVKENSIPETNKQYGIIQFVDANDAWASYQQTEERTDGIRRHVIGVRRFTDEDTYHSAWIAVQRDIDNVGSFAASGDVKQSITNFFAPSTKYVNLTLHETLDTADVQTSRYTAPGNGYFMLNVQQASNNGGFWMYGDGNICTYGQCLVAGQREQKRAFLPCAKGRTVQIDTYHKLTVNTFRFIYAIGG